VRARSRRVPCRPRCRMRAHGKRWRRSTAGQDRSLLRFRSAPHIRPTSTPATPASSHAPMRAGVHTAPYQHQRGAHRGVTARATPPHHRPPQQTLRGLGLLGTALTRTATSPSRANSTLVAGHALLVKPSTPAPAAASVRGPEWARPFAVGRCVQLPACGASAR